MEAVGPIEWRDELVQQGRIYSVVALLLAIAAIYEALESFSFCPVC